MIRRITGEFERPVPRLPVSLPKGPNFREADAPIRVLLGTYGSGKSWTRPSLLMPNDEVSGSGSNPDREPFITIDDLVQRAGELFVGIKKLSEFKYPLDIRRGVRKGVKKRMSDDRQSRQIKARGRTYFLDIEKTKGGKPYLRITESRKGEGDKFERNSINVFPEDADEFAQAVSEMVSGLGQEKTR